MAVEQSTFKGIPNTPYFNEALSDLRQYLTKGRTMSIRRQHGSIKVYFRLTSKAQGIVDKERGRLRQLEQNMKIENTHIKQALLNTESALRETSDAVAAIRSANDLVYDAWYCVSGWRLILRGIQRLLGKEELQHGR